ncbi:MAG: hypothetical protein H0T54_03180 [Geodermatophilaceae bacterium]|nr:hypothetical protein [Geodermatophilaceae bacterium]
MIVATRPGLYPVGSLIDEIARLPQLATVVLNEHVNDHGLCAVCPGVAFPCESVVLAEHAAALL